MARLLNREIRLDRNTLKRRHIMRLPTLKILLLRAARRDSNVRAEHGLVVNVVPAGGPEVAVRLALAGRGHGRA